MKMKLKLIALLLVILIAASSVGVFATWQYAVTDLGLITPLSTLLNPTMTPWNDFPEDQLTVAEKFHAILNSDVETDTSITVNGTEYTDSFEALIAAFENSATNGSISFHNDSYIGSMQTTGEDAEAIISLFGDALKTEQGKNEYYDVMIKRENLDGNTTTGLGYYMNGDHGWHEENKYYMGTEIVLFSTNEEIPKYNAYYRQNVTVYATVYTRKPVYDTSGNPVQKTFTDDTGTYPVYHYVYNSGTVNGYEAEVYKKNNAYYSVEDSSYVAGSTATVYEVYDYSGSEWTEIGYYTGEAMVVNYSSGSSIPSFDTGQWRNTEDYGYGTGLTLAQCVHNTLNP